jgi:hypothetical protein
MMLPDRLWKGRAHADGERLLAAWATAEFRVAESATRLRQEEQEAVLHGRPLDEDAFDRLVCAYCRAKRDALVARQAWQRWQAERAVTSDWANASGSSVPTARLRFARWLYLHGRIAG